MLIFGNLNWVFLWDYIVHVFSLIFRYFWRFSDEKYVENESVLNHLCEDHDDEDDHGEKIDYDQQIEEVKESPKLENEVGHVCNANTSKYQFFAGNYSVCAYVEEPQTMNFVVQEMFVVSHDESPLRKKSLEIDDISTDVDFRGFLVDLDDKSLSNDFKVDAFIMKNDDCGELSEEEEVVKQKKTECSVLDDSFEEQEVISCDQDEIFKKEEIVVQKDVDDVCSLISNSNDFWASIHKYNFDEILYDKSCVEELEPATPIGIGDIRVDYDQESPSSMDEFVINQRFSELDDHEVDFEHEGVESLNVVGDTRVDYDQKSPSSMDDFVINQRFSELDDHEVDFGHEVVESLNGVGDTKVDCDQESTSSMDDLLINQKLSELDDLNFEIEHEGFECPPSGVDDMRLDYDQDSPRSKLDDLNVEVEHVSVESLYIELVPESYCSTKQIENHLGKDEFSDTEEDDIDEESLKFSEMKDLDDSENGEVDDQMGGDVLLEQKELIRQMKKEMRQLKISGLPTILEESESPRVEEDLRPLKIDERIGHKDRMDEIQTFYRRYLDKMRKLDILSQQTMYAIGLLQLKNQDLALNKKVSVPVIKSLLAQNFWSNKLRKHETDPVQKLIRDLQRDLELVYVGQLCLSWEMLKWQHHKAEVLQANDPDGFRQHNQVAGEFQKFQVLLQRFTEDEPYHQGPRVQHYVKSRCGLPALLQVPQLKDDPKSEWRRNGEDGISVKMLKEVIGASMRAFWDFLHADKEEVCTISLIGIHGAQVILQDPSDNDLLTEIRSSLQKKEKRLKDLVRSGNCLVKKFKKHQDQRLSHETLVAQVELRLVSRVLSMPKLTTDQLLWCHKKLNKIDIIGSKIYLEYSFLLFPC